jgi:hypothetical protein
MRLPNVERAEIAPSKLTGYLLSLEHRFGRAKAVFFLARGFSPGQPDVLAEALREHAIRNDVVAAQRTAFGTRYRVEGPLVSPDHTAPGVRSVWFIGTGDVRPRFVTAYPLKAGRKSP